MRTVNTRTTRLLTEEAIQDLELRTLASFPNPMSRVVYLASLRDYNTGRYQHDGLESQFGAETAAEAIESCHQTIYEAIALSSIEELVANLQDYAESLPMNRQEILTGWTQLGAFRVIAPLNTHPTTVELFASNIRATLAILQSRQPPAPEGLPAS